MSTLNPVTLGVVSPPAQVRTTTADLYDQHVLGNYARSALTLVRGSGSRVWDDAGREYLDFTSGIAVGSLGHCHPAWVEAIRRQAGELIHVSNLFRNPQQGELAHRLVREAGPGKVFFCNSGTEANEALIKLSRLHGRQKAGGEEGRVYRVVCAENAFHGRTFGGMSATPQEKVQKGFRPLLPGFVHGRLNDLAGFEALMDETTAAVFLETIQGEGGVHPCTVEFLQGLRRLCTERGILLMLDEVQCGIGRTGTMFAYQAAGVLPDAIGLAKGLGGGFPIGAVWVAERFTGLFQPGSHGTTFGGNPLACAAALAVLRTIEAEDLTGRVRAHSPAWVAGLRKLVEDFPAHFVEVRGAGYLMGLQLRGEAPPWVAALREAGLLVPSAGGNTLRLLPPLVAGRQELDESLAILRRVAAAR